MSHQPSIFFMEELRRMPIDTLREVFREVFLTRKVLLAGDQTCLCDRRIVAFAKTMDSRLVKLMTMALDYLKANRKQYSDLFDKRDVYGRDSVFNADFNKLHVWDLVERVRYRVYRFTPKGIDFLFGQLRVPKTVWIYNDHGKRDKVQKFESEDYVSVNDVDERWQITKRDYEIDYINLPHETVKLV